MSLASAVVGSRPVPESTNDSHKWWVLGVVAIGSLMSILDATVVNIALPKLMATFSTDINGVQWILTGYLLALAMVIPLTGFLDETFGGKKVYLITLTLFTVASALCGLSWSLDVMIFFRVLQGLGGGLIQPLGQSMILREFAPHERGIALSIMGVPLMLGPAFGPTLGGYLVQYVDWRLIFYINVPIGIIAVVAASRLLREAPTDHRQKLDLWGIVLVAVGSAALLFGIDNSSTLGWGSPEVILEIAAGLVLLTVFVVVELRTRQPLLELRLFRSVQFTCAVLTTLVIQVGLFGATFLLPVFLQNLRGMGAMDVGILLIPSSLVIALVLPISGRLFDRFGPRVVMVPGIILLIYATYLFTNLNLNTSNTMIIEFMCIRSVGMGLAMMPAMTCAMNAVPRQLLPRATALTNALQRISGSFGTAIMATVLASRQSYQFALHAQTVTSFTPGVRQALTQVQGLLATHHISGVAAQQLGTQLVYAAVSQAAAVSAFDDTFLVATVICVPALIAAFFVTNRGGRRPTGAGAVAIE